MTLVPCILVNGVRCNAQLDELLEPYREQLLERWQRYQRVKKELEAHEGGPLEFSRVCIKSIKSCSHGLSYLAVGLPFIPPAHIFHDVHSLHA